MSPRATLALASAAVLLTAADTYVVVLALPDMMTGVGLGLDELQRGSSVVTGFLLGYVVVLPLAGRVSDLAGRLPVIVACLVLFTVGSLVTASSGDLTTMVTGRVVQGLGAGGLVPPTLALVGDIWPPARRSTPLGVVGAAQEVGAVAGPLLGAVVLAASGWRAIFWVNLAAGTVLAVTLAAGAGRRLPPRRTAVAVAVSVVGALLLAVALRPPDWLTSSVSLGAVVLPLADDAGWTSPLAVAVAVCAACLVVLVPSRAVLAGARQVDLPGALLLATCLAGVVVTFARAEVSRSLVADQWPWLLGISAVAAVGFVWRMARARDPLVAPGTLRAPGAWGAVVVNVLVGAGLVAVLVNVPIFARVTRYPDSQLAAALVLAQFLVALPVGALAGGRLSAVVPPRWVATAGLLLAAGALVVMSRWDAAALDGVASTLALVAAGLGFGLAIAPVTTVLLGATPPEVHGLASALAVLGRTMGMLVGLSALTAIGLRVFYREQARAGSPLELCPDSPADCPAYVAATQAALLAEQQAVFVGAAACALVAAVLAAVLLRARHPSVPRGQG